MAPRASRRTPLAGGGAGPPRSRVLEPINPAPNPDTNPLPNPVEPEAHHPGTPPLLHFEPRGSKLARSGLRARHEEAGRHRGSDRDGVQEVTDGSSDDAQTRRTR